MAAQRLYFVEMNDEKHVIRLIRAASPQAARAFASKPITARIATTDDLLAHRDIEVEQDTDPEPPQ